MGIVAFIMALYLRATYAAVCVAAVVPAILYYVGVYVQADRYAAKESLPPLAPEEVPRFGDTLREGWSFLLAFGVLVYTLFIAGWDAEYSALMGALSLYVLSMFRKDIRLTPRKLLHALEGMGQAVLDIGTVCALVGLVVGCLLFSGLALSLANAFISISGGSLVPLLIMSGMACILLGMGLPIVTVYILVVIILVPALDTMKVSPLAAHMFVFYYSMLSFLTPPVMLSIFAASTIADSKPMLTAVKSMRFAIAAYIVPFAFVFDPYLLLQGDVSWAMGFSLVSALLGVITVGVGLEGYVGGRVSLVSRLLLLAAGLAALSPFPGAKAVGMGGAMLLIGFFTARGRAAARRQAPA
jgi:TRAP transporter 4TM/12TM fusion protein